MKKLSFLALMLGCMLMQACKNDATPAQDAPAADQSTTQQGQSGVQDDVSQKNVVQLAAGSKDHTTLVKAVQQAGLVDALSNAGPFTVFAPVNAAFDKLPAGTLETLLKQEKKDDLTDILQYHVSVGVYTADQLQDGQILGQVNGGNITFTKKDGKLLINGTATILASLPASNGIVHVIDGVLLPKK